ncbi:hypothetical protein GobsT_59140 [Gemmata obscuriglobus]|uniref:Uncharacterized protein n=1 Tax=Gemmata obscuriglobus TaxID=114 RepID=A0A2Z3GSH1_9BACT|nr:hypothetical protein [Gemmata obscuriglobus]AWM36298.1 hypothetical protein C1280_04230 [Gemmata obscuriglobus]QEG31093.1 hypothetical protein GobsT_59140 [Gemmata obscuriglobus]VTS10430.1 unnamed protein product [Gemmata obscuriglobus UQM 2246]
MSPPGERPDAGPDPDRPHKKSRPLGAALLLLGAIMAVMVFVEGAGRVRIRAVIAFQGLFAGGGTWTGIGLLLFPWTNRMVARASAENNALIAFRQLPLLWRVWLGVAVLLTIGMWIMLIIPR